MTQINEPTSKNLMVSVEIDSHTPHLLDRDRFPADDEKLPDRDLCVGVLRACVCVVCARACVGGIGCECVGVWVREWRVTAAMGMGV